MSIYITKSVQYGTKIEAFEKRGLTGQVSSKVAEGGVYPISARGVGEQIVYTRMAEELTARVAGTIQAYPTVPLITDILKQFTIMRYERPLLFVELKSGGEALNAYGMYEAATGKMGVYAGQPSPDFINSIIEVVGGDLYTSVPAGNTNLAGYIAYIWAMRGLQAFFAVGGGPVEGGARIHIPKEAVEQVQGIEAKPAQMNQAGQEIRAAVPGKEAGGVLATKSINFCTGSKLVAKGLRTVNVTSAKGVKSGVIFPYFREMLDSDPDYAFNIFIRLFRNCLVPSAEDLPEMITMLRRGFRYLASTHAGRMIQHIYFGMDLCIQAGGGLFMLEDGDSYAGFLIGGDVTFLHKNIVKKSMDNSGIEVFFASLNTHVKALEKIHSILAEISREDGTMETIMIEDLKVSPRSLRRMFQARRYQDVLPHREILNDSLAELKYTQTYWEINKENVCKFLQMFVSNSPLDDEPMYVHIDVLMNRSSNLLAYLSVFGGQAPSIYYGNTVKTIQPIDKSDPNLELEGTRRRVPHIPFVKKGLIAAAADWATVAKQSTFKFAEYKKKGMQVGFSDGKKRDGIVDGPLFDSFYSNLRVFSHQEVVQQGANKKRQLEKVAGNADGDEEMTPPKKKKLSYI